jgi:HEAT repeat protein
VLVTRQTVGYRKLVLIGIVILAAGNVAFAASQGDDRLTPTQREIELQKKRLDSADVEERRDALMKLRNFKRPDASRVAAAGLKDLVPTVRATATHAVVSLPQAEAVELLTPLLQDKMEFVRRETAYALGEVRSRAAVGALSNLLTTDKEAGVRAAAAVALGDIGDEAGVGPLLQILGGAEPAKGKKKSKDRENEFVVRAAAHALGQIRSRAAVPLLIAALESETNPGDLRREAALALGLIGDPSAAPALRTALTASDPYLSDAAREALHRLGVARN